MVANLSRINKIRSFANSPRLDRHEKPKRARVKKNTPEKWLVDKSPPGGNARTESILESGNIIAIRMSANLFKKKTVVVLTRHHGRRGRKSLKVHVS